MQILPVGKFKADFAQILTLIQQGERVGVSYGKKKKPMAVLVPYKKRGAEKQRKLGLLQGKAKVVIKKDFKMTDIKLLNS